MKRKHRRLRQEADLDITAFMNLMIVLVPILLINMIFASTSVLELNFPIQNDDQALENDLVQLQVIITSEQLLVADNKGGIIKQIDSKDGAYDFEMLGLVMQDLKARVPDKKDITVMAMKKTSYQTLVSVMDKVRSYPAVVAGSVVHAELFPEVSIADAPENINVQEKSVVLNNSDEKQPELSKRLSQDPLKEKS
ncbi:MAG: biopolymer transport protein ExbD [Oleiphilaceae bacterium]|jgi:biopolymer transport protein ExbD